MYSLMLEKPEREAFDWVSYRYSTGDEVAVVLGRCMSPDDCWYDDGDIIFQIPEHEAWLIRELSACEDDLWPCFADSLKAKMTDFVNNIV